MAATKGRKKKSDRYDPLVCLIRQRRRQCMVHRFLYYVLSQPIIDDQKYDMFERELRELVEKHPEIERKVEYDSMCPSRNVGSSNREDYPRDIEMAAISVLASFYAEKHRTTYAEEWNKLNAEVFGHNRGGEQPAGVDDPFPSGRVDPELVTASPVGRADR